MRAAALPYSRGRDRLPAAAVTWWMFLSVNASVFLSLPHSLRVSLDLALSSLTLHFSLCALFSPHVRFALSMELSFFLHLLVSISVSLSPHSSLVYCVCFPSRSERLGHREVFPFGECPASGPGRARPSLGVGLASCHPGPLGAVLAGPGKGWSGEREWDPG